MFLTSCEGVLNLICSEVTLFAIHIIFRGILNIKEHKGSEHNPDSSDNTKVLREIIEFKRNAVNRKDQGYVIVREV